tara:strand:+ start:162 stop:1277 length:1116 start_codon:yes stop_codon:yes gene_type:complete
MKKINSNYGRIERFSSLLLVTALTVCFGDVRADPPGLINYQGYLVDANGVELGKPDPTNYKVNFKIYDSQTGGSEMWSEIQVVTVDNGYFNVYLGEVNKIDSSVFRGFNASERFVGITVDLSGDSVFDESEIAPRLRLLSSPYALIADKAKTADHLSSTATASGTLTVSGDTSLTNATASGTLTVSGNTSLTSATASGTVQAKEFVGFGITPIGGIIMWSPPSTTAKPPDGWVLCDGSDYTVGGKTKAAPNLVNKFVRGSNIAGAGKIDGSDTAQLKVSNLPPHKHTGVTEHDGAHEHNSNGSMNMARGSHRSAVFNSSSDSGRHGVIHSRGSEHTHKLKIGDNDINNSMKAERFKIIPAHYTLAYIMRYK